MQPQYLRPLLHRAPIALRAAKWWNKDFGKGATVPSSLLRYLTFKILVDLQQIPALNELTLAGVRYDDWVRGSGLGNQGKG